MEITIHITDADSAILQALANTLNGEKASIKLASSLASDKAENPKSFIPSSTVEPEDEEINEIGGAEYNVVHCNIDIDAEGIPWDARIHASTKGQTAKGVWKRLRGIDDETYNSVKNQLLGKPEPVTPVFPQPIAAPVINTTRTYDDLLKRIQAQFALGKLPANYIPELNVRLQINSITDIMNSPGHVKLAHEMMDQDGY